MRAALVALLGDSRVYYDMDAKRGQKDAAVEKVDGSVIKMDLMHLSSTARNFTKLRNTAFQRFVWDSPKDSLSGAWYETFVEKTRPINDSLIDSMPLHSALGKNKKKIDRTEKSVKSFRLDEMARRMLSNSCCGEVVQLNVNDYAFKSLEERDFAWLSVKTMRSIEKAINDEQ